MPRPEEQEEYLKPKSRGIPNLPSLQSIVRRLYGEEEADRVVAGPDPEGFRRPTRSPILLARDRLDAFRAVNGVRPSHRRASEHYDESINQKDEDPSRDIQSGALVVLDLLLDWIERTQGSNVALLTNEGEVATASLRVNIEPRLENAEKEATDQALALVRVLRSKWA